MQGWGQGVSVTSDILFVVMSDTISTKIITLKYVLSIIGTYL